MRPALLNPLFAGATGLPGIGAKLERLLAQLLGAAAARGQRQVRVLDLLWHLPSGVIDRRLRPRIAEAPDGAIVTLKVQVGLHEPPPRNMPRRPYKVLCFDDSGWVSLVFFNAREDYLRKTLPQGEARLVSGRFDTFGEEHQIVHPDHIVSADQADGVPLFEPVYPLTAGLAPKVLAKAIRTALDRTPEVPEWQDAAWLASRSWPRFNDALRALHLPAASEPPAAARLRLAYDELLANQLALGLVRRQMRAVPGRPIVGSGALRGRIVAALPFTLTPSQSEAVGAILRDMAAPERMLRLLQGDVGAGKTVVALLALATAVEAGAQGGLMAPTDVLARQHFATLAPLCTAAGIGIDLLTGREKGKAREVVLARARSGVTGILIGTHALFQEDVAFQDLALVVVDEQHRFGVHQRLALQAKAAGRADLLVMTATPIPRTLALTHYGDMDISRLIGKPAGRQPIDTRALPLDRIEEVVDALKRAVGQGARAYWVCPLVEESEQADFAAAEARFAALAAELPGRVGLLHGRMKGAEKDAVMALFQAGEIAVLVATTVIEVGVDVAEATVMVIENAERFGLAQLHQLRGRVGRGRGKSACVLLYRAPLGEAARARLGILRETEDGFRIAEEDLRLRGAGELLGTRQSGMPEFRIADLALDGELLAVARDDANLVLARDPDLHTARGAALRVLLYLFERDAAVRLLGAG